MAESISDVTIVSTWFLLLAERGRFFFSGRAKGFCGGISTAVLSGSAGTNNSASSSVNMADTGATRTLFALYGSASVFPVDVKEKELCLGGFEGSGEAPPADSADASIDWATWDSGDGAGNR